MAEKNPRTGWFYTKKNPPNDNAYFENMARIILEAGLSWQLIQDKWLAFRKAFNNFDIDEVSNYTEEDIEELITNKDIIRNRAKIEAVIVNAIIFQEIREEYGSFADFLDTLDKSENYKFVKRELKNRFKRMGPKTSTIFLWSIGEDVERE